jgi:DNA-binding response OmpR family regulator
MPHQISYRALVVDDEEEYRTIVGDFLTNVGCATRIAADAAEALKALDEERYDLVISDIRMPGMDGLQLMREALKRYPHLSFIIMTGHAGEYTFSDIIEAGATDFIGKPFPMAELKAKLERIQREKSTLRALAVEAESNASFAELSRALLSPLSFESISEMVLNYAKHLTGSEIGFVGYIDLQSGYLACPTMSREVWENCHVEDKDIVLKKFKGLWGWVLENQIPVLSNAPQVDARSSGVPPGHLPI